MARVRAHSIPKGDPLEVARVAAIQAAKDTPRIVPFCHPIPIDHAEAAFAVDDEGITVTTTVRAIHKTGVEMEALTAAAVAALTLYDMLKMLDPNMSITEVVLLEKRGGKSDFASHATTPARVGVLVLSDSAAAGKRADLSGGLLKQRLEQAGLTVEQLVVLPDEPAVLVATVRRWTDELAIDLVLTTGGTGLGPRDSTPEAMDELFDREICGLSELLRSHGRERTPYAALSRGRAGVRGQCLIVNLPGAPQGALDALDAGLPAMLHALDMIRGGSHEHQDLARSLGT